MQRSALIVLAALAGAACGGEDDGRSSAPNRLDPKQWDCRAKGVPPRRTPLPVGCATDRSCTERMICGHRSAGGALGVLAPENTLSAVRAAVAVGADFVETDPRPTLDGVLVNVHDTSVDRTTTGSGEVSAMTLAQVQALEIDATGFAGDFSCDRVPTLEQVLLEARGKVHVLIDANKTDRVDLLVAAIVNTDSLEWAIFDTDGANKIEQALALEPTLHTMIRVSSTQELDAELAQFASHPPVLVELNDGASAKALAPSVHAAGHRVFQNAFGIDVAAGFADDPALYEQSYGAGVDVIQTDRPDLVAKHLGR